MQKQKEFTVAHAIAKELADAGVEVVYGIVSIHNMPIYDAILQAGKIRISTARGESGAVNMADAYARATGKVGVVITSTGSGAGNAAGSLVESWNASTPLLHITGEAAYDYIGTDQRFIHEAKNQQQMMEGAGKSSYLVQRPNQITSLMQKSIQEANTAPQGPVTISVPTDFQPVIVPNGERMEAEITTEETHVSLPTSVVEAIAQSKRPVLWIGRGAVHANASKELENLIAAVQPAILTSEAAKGVISEAHPLCIGNFVATPQVKQLLEKADLLLSIGVRFRGDQTFEWNLPIPENHINIDADPAAFQRSFSMKYSLTGNARNILKEINHQLQTTDTDVDDSYTTEVKEIKQTVQADLRKEVRPYDQFADVLNEQLPQDTILLTDVTIPGYTWGNKLVEIHEPRNYLYMTGGGIGQGLPMAIGAKMGQPNKPVVLIAGDGGFMVNANEMITAIQEDTPIIVLLFDDSGYGILKYYQEAIYGRQTAVELQNPDFEMMAKSMGFETAKANSVEDFQAGLKQALASGKSSMIIVDVHQVGVLEYEDSPEYIESFHPRFE